jgi:hypothetical protein
VIRYVDATAGVAFEPGRQTQKPSAISAQHHSLNLGRALGARMEKRSTDEVCERGILGFACPS